MIEHTVDTGDTGRLKILDKTDDTDDMTVELFVQSLSPVSIPQLPWTYSINTSISSWKSFNFQDTTMWQRLSVVYVGTAENFTLYLEDTGTSQLQGPTELEIDLYGYVPTVDPGPDPKRVNIKVGNQYKKATPYIKVDGVWKVAVPFVRVERGWTEIV
ncbi:MAG: hypothetical protein LC687_01545 [Actinobacteria bacterium]|nr:hypothetical protein [Actinomycetota bacterium]